MALAFARMEYVSRSQGKNACHKSSYNSRAKVKFDGTKFQEAKVYNFSSREKIKYHEILLPLNAPLDLKNAETLWNKVEKEENRKNSQLGRELVIALPDDEVISDEDRIHLATTFVKKHFVEKGFCVQCDIHPPDRKAGKKHNNHAHILITPRRIEESGNFEKNKPRELNPVVKKGFVISDANDQWGKLWMHHQNEYFEEKGIPLSVDLVGVISQKHLGPIRLRGKGLSRLFENDSRIESNKLMSTDPQNILSKMTETKSIFSAIEVDQFLQKHVSPEDIFSIREKFWSLDGIVELIDKKSLTHAAVFSTRSIIDEESKIVRLADRIQSKDAFVPRRPSPHADAILSKLSSEQVDAFKSIISGKRLSCIEGHAGTGKSYLLAGLKDYYQYHGLKVRAFGPDNATAKVLEDKGFEKPENVHRFLFSLHNNKKFIQSSNEVWIIDEAGKLGNKPLFELLKEAEKSNAHVILSGSSSQMSSVERGGFFKVFCEKYGAVTLSDIQRQKFESHRQMAKAIAVGDVSQAINRLCANGGLHWSKEKQESLHALIDFWAKDSVSFPLSSVLIIARSNRDTRILNELARDVLKERGVISQKEYQCESIHGSICVSEGDRIEFRKNDTELGVTNGMSGTLVEASEKEFVVSLDSEKEEKGVVRFDPRSFQSFQLGYASTYYRSQGRTVDRAYVLHSQGMNKKEFYVGITRHTKTVHLFLSREEAKSLSHLKWHLNQDKETNLTTQFTTQADLDLDFNKQSRTQTLQGLKQSGNILHRIGGYGLSFLDSIKQKTERYYQSKTDLKKNEEFYNPKIDLTNKKTEVTLLPEETNSSIEKLELQPSIPLPTSSWTFLTQEKKDALEAYYSIGDKVTSLKEIVEDESISLSTEIKFAPHFKEWQKACGARNVAAYQLFNIFAKEELKIHFSEKSLEKIVEFSKRHSDAQEVGKFEKEQAFSFENVFQGSSSSKLEESKNSNFNFSEEDMKIIQNYRHSVREASMLREVVLAEAEGQGKEMKELSRFKDLQKAWGERNKNALLLRNRLSADSLSSLFGDIHAASIREQAERFEYFEEKAKHKLVSYEELERKLLDNVESLLYRIFPDGPSRKEHHKLRYGSKGALCVNISGPKAGSFYDFASQEGGGLLKLIGKVQNITLKESEKWAKEFLDLAPTIEVPRGHQISKTQDSKNESNWVAIRPNHSNRPKEFYEVNFGKEYKETARYPYKDFDGNLLFYVVRLVDKENGKITLPLSYGHYKNCPQRSYWSFKQYATENRPLYNLNLLQDNPGKPILIVEGEKAADTTSKQFTDFVVISWSGGSGAVSKTDWSPLKGQDIVIWADNDSAGFKAANQICSELRKQGVKKLRMVEFDKLSKEFPEKWDLADPLPSGKTQQNINDMLTSAKESAVNPEQVFLLNGGKDPHPAQLARINEILWRVDERLRGQLEKKHENKSWEIGREIIQETLKVLNSEKETQLKIEQDLGVSGALKERLVHQSMIFSAQNGVAPSSAYLEHAKAKIREATWLQDVDQKVQQITKDKEIRNLAMDKAIEGLIFKNSSEAQIHVQKDVLSVVTALSNQMNLQKAFQCESTINYFKEL